MRLLVVALLVLVLAPGLASGQPAPGGPPSTPAGGPPPSGGAPPSSTAGGQTPNLPPSVLNDTIWNVAEEASLLETLGAFVDVPSDLDTALASMPDAPTSRPEQIAAFTAADEANQQQASTLLALQPPISKELATVLPQLSAADRQAVETGHTISLNAATYLDALDDLVQRGGRPPQSAGPRTIDPGRIAANLAAQENDETPSSVPPSSPPPGPPSSTATTTAAAASARVDPGVAAAPRADAGNSLPVALLVGVAVLVIAALLMGVVLARRTSPSPALAAAGAGAGVGSGAVGGASIDDLLEVSRRLSAVTSVAEVERASVREAVGLVSATGAAFVRREGDDLVIAHQTQDDLLNVEHMPSGIVGRVAETGQPVLQVSATEPSVRNLPVALAAVPVVGGGRVTAVLLLMRPPTEPFTEHDRELLMALAPVAATALLSAERADSLAEQSLVDPLTGVGNRRRLDTELGGFLRDATGPTGVIMVDLDHFKAVNDTHGHPAGDALLRQVSALLREHVRPHDHVYRYGGEEFCVVLPDTSTDEAHQAAERVGDAIRSAAFDAGLAAPLRATVSMGVATTRTPDAAELIGRADRALYEAKQTGRDRVVVAPDV